ncbi:sugar phosphate isomerase/epimerase [Mesorhizobium sp. CA8]|nr:sugar phosphate isomerase/epimerase [Mesorhizobium sp. CA8]
MKPEPLAKSCDRLVEFGYESLEIYCDPGLLSRADSVRELLANRAVRCWGGVMWPYAQTKLLTTNANERSAYIRYAIDCLNFVHRLKGQVLVVVPGFGREGPAASPQEEWYWCVDALQEINASASRLGIRLALEPLNRFETHFLNRLDQALLLADAVGGDCGVCMDAFHANIEEPDPVGAIRLAGSKLADYHLADSNRLAPGMGHYDWAEIIDALAAAGYKGGLPVEFVPFVDRTPLDPAFGSIDQGEHGQVHSDTAGGVVGETRYRDLVRRSAETILPHLKKVSQPE